MSQFVGGAIFGSNSESGKCSKFGQGFDVLEFLCDLVNSRDAEDICLSPLPLVTLMPFALAWSSGHIFFRVAPVSRDIDLYFCDRVGELTDYF